MKVPTRHPEGPKDEKSELLFFVILGVVVLILAVFLLLKPRGSDARPSRNSRSFNAAPLIQGDRILSTERSA
jgi:hypothetical protein